MASQEQHCPYLIPVTADHLWMYPVSAFCRRPDGAIRVPAPRTLEQICGAHFYAECTQFLATVSQDARNDGC